MSSIFFIFYCLDPPPPHVKGWGFVGDCKLCNNLKILKCFDYDGDGIYPVYRIYPEKGIQPVRYHNEEAYGCSIYGGMRKIRTYETLFTFTV